MNDVADFMNKNKAGMVELEKLLTSIPAIAPEGGGDGEALKCAALEKWLKENGFENIQRFEFNFDSDTDQDSIQLSQADITLTQFFARAYIYGYQLRSEGINSSKLVSWLKEQMDEGRNINEIKKLVDDALIKLHKNFNLNNYKCIVYPDTTHNELTEYIIVKIRDIIYEFEKPTAYYSIIKNFSNYFEI